MRSAPKPHWLELWSAVDAMAAETTHATWGGGQVVRTEVVDGVERPVIQMPYVTYSEAVNRVWDALVQVQALPVPSPDWDGRHRYRTPDRLATASVADAARFIRAILMSERFCDGSLEDAIKSGLLPAALLRIRRWWDEGE